MERNRTHRFAALYQFAPLGNRRCQFPTILRSASRPFRITSNDLPFSFVLQETFAKHREAFANHWQASENLQEKGFCNSFFHSIGCGSISCPCVRFEKDNSWANAKVPGVNVTTVKANSPASTLNFLMNRHTEIFFYFSKVCLIEDSI